MTALLPAIQVAGVVLGLVAVALALYGGLLLLAALVMPVPRRDYP